jgi:hypothetical protein
MPRYLPAYPRDAHVHSDFPLSRRDYRIVSLTKLFGMLKIYDGIEVHVISSFEWLGAG